MKKKYTIYLLALSALFASCKIKNDHNSNYKPMNFIEGSTVHIAMGTVKVKYPKANFLDTTSGVHQVAKFWMESDGSKDDFINFCEENYLSSDSEREVAFEKISRNMEILHGNLNRISLGLKQPLHEDRGEIAPIDQMFGGYDPSSHLSDDFFHSKIAFYILLNFKFFPLAEKNAQGPSWSRLQWAHARLAESTDSRVPAALLLKFGDINAKADSYISEYNIYMGNLLNEKHEKPFPANLKLLSHWGLRDELKACYSADGGIEKQRMIFQVMNHIIQQDIPEEVINSDKYQWDPLTNKLFEKGKEVASNPEPDTRYDWLLENFKALKEMDAYNPFYPTYIQSKFDCEMEISQPEVEKLFTDLVSSPEVKQVAALIEKRLGRKLEPFDIWYDGFKSHGAIDFPKLDKEIEKKYPNAEAFHKDIPSILISLGFRSDKAEYIASKIQVDAARGSGHAWGASIKGDKAHLRTRIGKDGMDYQGFNVAMHELGHCVEQTITLYDIDHYLLNGVPNTAFTEALAFIFQKRDLDILGIKDNLENKNELMALDIFWSNYEIMGVSLVDMNVWKWLYLHPDATKQQLKEAVISIAKEVWNKYYAPVFGAKDQPILAIYSHMIDYPLYLSAYPIGYLIDFQLEKQIEGKNFSEEIMRIFHKGCITPQQWMKEAVGHELSVTPLLEAVDKALTKVK
jgi:hypothetical protein